MPRAAAGPPYDHLDAWQACHELALLVFRASRAWPVTERDVVTLPARRAAISAAARLVEGVRKPGARALRRYAANALGALAELEYLLLFARDAGMIGGEEWAVLNGHVTRAGQLTGGLYRALRTRVS